MTSRRWCFTSFKDGLPTLDDRFANAEGPLADIRYVIYQREVAPTTGRQHLQGYIELRSPMRMRQVQGLLGDDEAHLEVPRGSRRSCRDYCRKNDTRLRGSEPVEYGTFDAGGQGVRTDIISVRDIVRDDPTERGVGRIFDEFPGIAIRYQRGLSAMFNHYAKQRAKRLRRGANRVGISVIVHHGNTGTGKTRKVYDDHEIDDIWRAPVSTTGSQWFDGYLGQKVALFDDFDGKHPAITHMLQILDIYPINVQVKGGFTYWCPEIIYITTNVPIDKWYPDAAEEHILAIKRRITTRVHFDKEFS